MGVIATGFDEVIDLSDGKTIVAVISPAIGYSQAYKRDGSGAAQYTPSWGAGDNVLTLRATANGADITAGLTNVQWAEDLPVSEGGVSLGTGLTLAVGNLTAAAKTYYFEASWLDTDVGFSSPVTASITLTRNEIGTNATWLNVRGVDRIEQGVSVTKNWSHMIAELFRGSAIDNDGLEFKWFTSPFQAGDQLDDNHPLVIDGSIRFRTKTQSEAAPSPSVVTDALIATLDPTTNRPGNGAWSDCKEILIRETAVQKFAHFLVQVRDTAVDSTIYTREFVVSDISDPWSCNGIPSARSIKNGSGTITVTPMVSNGARQLTDTELGGCTFIRDRNFTSKQGFVVNSGASADVLDGTVVLTCAGDHYVIIPTGPVAGKKVIARVTASADVAVLVTTYNAAAGVSKNLLAGVPTEFEVLGHASSPGEVLFGANFTGTLLIDYIQVGDGYWFEWVAQRNGQPYGFVDRDVTEEAYTILGNSETFVQLTESMLQVPSPGQLAKITKTDGSIIWAEIAPMVNSSPGSSGFWIKTSGQVNSWVSSILPDNGTSTALTGAKLLICNPRLTTPGVTPIVLNGYDIDGRVGWSVSAVRP